MAEGMGKGGRYLATGIAGGLLSGFAGVGGGVVFIPLMVRLLGMTQHRAHGTSLAIIVPTALAAVTPYLAHAAGGRPLPVDLALACTSGALAGAPLGARALMALSPARARQLFGSLLLVIAAGTLWRAVNSPGPAAVAGAATGVLAAPSAAPAHWGSLGVAGWAAGLGIGWFTGVLSGAMGIGGGVILVPSSVLLLGLEQHQAQGLSLLVMAPTALMGAWSHHRHRNLEPRVAALIALGAVGGGLAGAHAAQALPSSQLQAAFGVLVLCFGLQYAGVAALLRSRLRRHGDRRGGRSPSGSWPWAMVRSASTTRSTLGHESRRHRRTRPHGNAGRPGPGAGTRRGAGRGGNGRHLRV
jgi:uncharacterized membrane protein YfcA